MHDWTTSGGCVYCYVDDKSNNPSISKNGVWITADNILDTAERLRANSSIRNNRELHRIRHSGGEPTIELDFTLNIMEEIEKRGLEKLYLQIDTNLSTGKFIRQMILEKEYPEDILGQLSAHGVTVYAAFKGTSDENIQYNTQAKLTVDDQLDSFELLLDSGLEVFPCIYNPDYRALPNFLDKLKNISEPSVKRLRVEPINWSYGPTACRMEELAKLNKIAPEKELENYRKIEEENFEKSEVIMRGYLDKFGLKYKEFDRTKIEL